MHEGTDHVANQVAEHGTHAVEHAGQAIEHAAGHAAGHAADHGVDLMALVYDSNVINFGIVLIAVLWFMFKFLPKSAADTRAKLEEELKEAKAGRVAAEKKLEDLTDKLSNSEAEAKKIVEEAQNTAKMTKEQILKETEEQSRRMVEMAEKDIEMKKNQAISSIKDMAAKVAINFTEESIRQATKDPKVLEELQGQFAKELTKL